MCTMVTSGACANSHNRQCQVTRPSARGILISLDASLQLILYVAITEFAKQEQIYGEFDETKVRLQDAREAAEQPNRESIRSP
jgi:hypothetical protein